jgi:hypothetical protein
MATQFKHIDFPAAPAPSRAPNAALAAVTQAFGSMPEQTLDEAAEQPQQLDLAAWDAALGKAEAAITVRDAHWDEHIEPLFTDAGVELRKEPNWQAYRPLAKAAARAAVELARLAPPDQNGFILAVRLLCDTAMLDVADALPYDGEAVVDEIKRHAGDLLDGAVVRDRFMGGALAHWQRLWSAVEETRAECRRYEAEVYNPVLVRYVRANARLHAGEPAEAVQADIDALAEVEAQDSCLAGGYCDARDQLYRAPAPGPAELAVKLQLMAAEQDWARCDERTAEVLASDARRFARLGAFLQRDAELLSAFAECRRGTEEWLAADSDLDEASSEEADAAIRAAEDRIFAARATTIEGVLAKLRLAFKGNVGCAWSDRAIADPTHADFQAGLSSSDWYTRLVWGAIDDLAKLGGVDLASIGADGRATVTPLGPPAAAVEPRDAGPPHPTADETAGLRSILNERNAALGQLEAPDLADEAEKAICSRISELEERLLETPAISSDDVMTKLLLIAHIVAEGSEPTEQLAAKVLAEARGLGVAERAQPWVEAA